jgi:preprotein translocase subunit SecA
MSQGLAEFAAAAAQQAQGQVATQERPAGVQAKGIQDNDRAPALTYSGPAEDGSAEVQRSSGGRHAAPEPGSRKERREAARQQARQSKRR